MNICISNDALVVFVNTGTTIRAYIYMCTEWRDLFFMGEGIH